MKVAIYCRVSKEETNKDDNRYQEPKNQLDPLRDWVKSRGWDVYKEYTDRGSGANPARENFRKLMSDAMLLRFNCILVWKLDRFSREGISQIFAYLQKLRSRGIALKSLTESWLDTGKDNPMSELILAVMSWASNLERQKISERTKLGIQRRKNLGIWKGGRPTDKITEKQIKIAKQLLDNGKNIPYIQRRLKVSKRTLNEKLKGGMDLDSNTKG